MPQLMQINWFPTLLSLVVLAGAPFALSAADPAPGTAEATHDVPGPVRLTLPPTIYAVVGHQMNVYFDNVTLVLNPDNYAFDVACAKGRQQSERWTYTPAAQDVGSHPFELTVRNEQNELIASGRCELRVVAEAKTDLSVLMIGDSLTHASVYPARVAELAEKAGAKMKLVGSHHPENQPEHVRHEGYGGWTAKRFATHYKPGAPGGDYKDRGSPFLYAEDGGNPALNFARYCQAANEGRFPDVVTIFLGPNDIFRATDETLESTIDDMLTHYEAVVKMIRQATPTTRIAAMLPVPPAATQDAFGANYASGQTRWQYKRNQHRLVERMLAAFSGREDEGVHLIPAYINLDCLRNYPTAREPIEADGEQVLRLNNGVHPAPAGYRQIGDSLYAWLSATSS
ncbi:MAG TPA: GDSL-type esterase/lipase family protein [Pirellulales bacterium]|nr:GDSL-type esterase/lipase family protein [Pirellulales bacterium]